MCYSARIKADHRDYVRRYGAAISMREFVDLFYRRLADPKLKVPKAMEAAFAHPGTPQERQIAESIEAHRGAQATRLEQELFAQRKRLADAQRRLQIKVTKTASEEQRIAAAKIEHKREQLAALGRTELLDDDARIFPQVYAPVMVVQHGRKVVLPMRYQCRMPGMPASADVEFGGTYNARRDNLEKFWRPLFGHRHGVLLIDAFYENVARHRIEGRELAPGEKPENVVLAFRPRPAQVMAVACLWSRWTAPGQPELLSFAAITDEPPPEIAAAGHDRCIVPLRAENVDAWLNPDPRRLQALHAILDDRERPYYEHRLAA